MSTQAHISVRRRGIRNVTAPRGPLSNFRIRSEAQLRSCIYHVDANYSVDYFKRPDIIGNAVGGELPEDLKLKQEIPEKDAKEFALPFLALNSRLALEVIESISLSGYQNLNRRSPDNIPLLVYIAAKTPELEKEDRDQLFDFVLWTGADPRCIPMELWRRPSLPIPLQLSQDPGPMADWCTAERLSLLAPHLTVFMRDSLRRFYEALDDFCDTKTMEIEFNHIPPLYNLRELPWKVKGQNYALRRLIRSLRSHFSEDGPERSAPYCAMLMGTSASSTSCAMGSSESPNSAWRKFDILFRRSEISLNLEARGLGGGDEILSKLDKFLVANDAKTKIVRFDNLLDCDVQLDGFYNEIRKIISNVEYRCRRNAGRAPVDISKMMFLFTSSFADDLIAEHNDKWLPLREINDWQQKSSPDATPDRFMTLVEFSETPTGSTCMDELVQAVQDKARSNPDSPAWALAGHVCDRGTVIPHFPLEWEDVSLLTERRIQQDALAPCQW
ncbi:hypothetical protein MCOR25_006964 [Pyricularia grisea]|uniref:Uncharacterized protein n=1 Tax=Pyricularia grisea TaxID=148305 RepID=A0A6P8BBF9_PYRGI|nr:uncharacterized protein PgNI_03386 [Pyricularia grisea]KAI6359697.1 hypothetical protein MCOR25_006964 [Pyricularia grisea]TLD13032.1 hypothetical protein PgNI_03386 [Pyricularia grisea]